MILETKNLWLKTTEMEDAKFLHEAYFTDVPASRNALWKPSTSLQDTEKFLRLAFETKQSLLFTIVKKPEKQPIGVLSITRNKDKQDVIDSIGIGFSTPQVHKGFGNEVLLSALEFCFFKIEINEINISFLKDVGITNNIYTLFGFEPSPKGETEEVRKHTNEKLTVVNLVLTKEKWLQQRKLLGLQ